MPMRSAIPVTMPGRAMGRRISNEMKSLPKNRVRYSAPAANVPSTMAIRVAVPATRIDIQSACQKSARPNVTLNQFKVRAGGGNWYVDVSVVKAYSVMTASGKYKNVTAPTVANVRGQEVRSRVAVRLERI